MEPRRRAPHRSGQRTTLRVPTPIMSAARDLAEELGTTPNDALVRLAEDGAAARERRRHAENLARVRRQTVAQAEGAGMLPSPAELRAAMLSGRHAP